MLIGEGTKFGVDVDCGAAHVRRLPDFENFNRNILCAFRNEVEAQQKDVGIAKEKG